MQLTLALCVACGPLAHLMAVVVVRSALSLSRRLLSEKLAQRVRKRVGDVLG